MKKTTCASLLVVLNILVALAVEAAPAAPKTAVESKAKTPPPGVGEDKNATSEKFDIMRRDERSGTDVFAIPLDESEVEDEEDINEYEKKNVFNLPEKR
jgi:hypothetical protein